MKKLYSLLVLLLLVTGIMAGCGSNEAQNNTNEGSTNTEQAENTEDSAFPVTITDALDQDVTIEEDPQKIVTLIPSNTEILFALGAGEEVVGVTDFDNYPEETADIEKIGGMEFNIEKIISLEADLVLAHASSASTAEAGLQQLRDAGITVLVVNDDTSFDEVYKSMEMIGKATGETEAAEATISDMKNRLDEIQTQAETISEDEQKSVFVEVSPAPEIYSPGKNTFMDDMLTLINAKNVTHDEEGWNQIDQEAIIKANPDVIITTYGYYSEKPVEQVLSRDGWQDVTAVTNEQVVDVHSDLVTRSGPRLVEGVEELAKAVYPDVFAE
ncbi:ABC transporter substrate-binding protein [Guptibacillus hwajinpoensis]|uniref:Iron complex transport system substrate-binding protein n=1 Tax=Guptibacillus hwajinpoensis TaxID=208199 RepID=A0ABU0K2M4_9BACL|nr:ABC transporter substrate-binding protein [Alkalihalobacillus hemicentroti]MDQ0482412.1 iron complex transport system substrate-binding protein [Alkalihalobacillus hemicentroti]